MRGRMPEPKWVSNLGTRALGFDALSLFLFGLHNQYIVLHPPLSIWSKKTADMVKEN